MGGVEMKASELRIGNYIIELGIDYDSGGNKFNDPLGNEIIKVDLETLRFLSQSDLGYTSIPLTEDILVRCGFVRNGNEYTKDGWMMGLSFDELYSDWHVYERRDSFHLTTIKHFHQLQNLYFALTGEELIINL